MKVYSYSLSGDFEFGAKMPEELLVKAMTSTRPIFITDDFIARVATMSPDKVVREMVRDLHRETDPDDTDEVLRWHYLFMDFEQDFPRLLLMYEASQQEQPQAE